MRRHDHVRLGLHELEGRDTPADLAVNFAAATGTLTVTGTPTANELVIAGDAADPTRFVLSSTTDTIGGAAGAYTSPTGVKNLVLRMKAGDDTVTLAASPAITLVGSLTIDGGDGANWVSGTELTVDGNISIRNGTNVVTDPENPRSDSTRFYNVNVGGGLTVANGAGGSLIQVRRNGPGVSYVGGSVRVTNGAGDDSVILQDLNIGGDVIVRHGRGGDPESMAGETEISNIYNRTARSIIRGSVSVSYLDGPVAADVLLDADVGGDVTYSYAAVRSQLHFAGNQTFLPTIIRGNVTVSGTGGMYLDLGGGFWDTGAIIGKNFRVTGGPAADELELMRLTVHGTTTLALGGGNNAVTVDDSLFIGAFTLTTGAGVDTVKLDTKAGTAEGSTFHRPVRMSLGAGVDAVTLGGSSDANQAIVFAGGCLVRHGTDGESPTRFGRELYPFGGDLQWVE